MCLLGAVMVSTAAELVIRDVRGAALLRPTAFDFSVDSATVVRSGDDAFDSGTGFEIGSRYSWAPVGSALGLVAGGDLAYDSYTYDGDGGMGSYGLRLSVGLGWAFADRWTLLAEGGGNYVLADLELPASQAATAIDASGDGFGYDARLSLMFRFSRRWALHGHVGYLMQETTLEGHGATVDLEQAGIYAGLGFTWQFSNRPTGLE